MIKQSLKFLYYLMARIAPAAWLPRRANILMYHSVSPDGFPFCVSPEMFEKQMRHLSERKYNVVALAKLDSYLSAKKIPPKTVLLTFDDGYEDNYSQAYPILRKYDLPATIFVSTGWLGKSDNKYSKKCLSAEQMKEMHDSGLIDFQPHTVNHPKLSGLGAEAASAEIEQSKKYVENLLGKRCDFFAYPFGRYNEDVLKIARDKFKLAVATSKGLVGSESERFRLNRNAIDSAVGMHEFNGIVKVGRI